MKMFRYWFPFFLLFFLVAMPERGLRSKEPIPNFQIVGCEAISCKVLFKKFGLKKRSVFSRRHLLRIGRGIKSYYRRKGYRHARVRFFQPAKRKSVIYLDEGKFNKVIFSGVDVLLLVKLHASLKLDPLVYHPKKILAEIKRLKKAFGFKSINYELVKAEDYSKATFQIDKNLSIFGLKNDPINLKKPSPRYNLKINIEFKEKIRTKGLSFGLRVEFRRGFIPYVHHEKKMLFLKQDKLENEVALGFLYGLDFKFKTPPRSSLVNLSTSYYFPPLLKKQVQSMIKNQFNQLLETREDVGLENYHDIRYRSILINDISISKNFFISIGYGFEAVFLSKPEFVEGTSERRPPLSNFVDRDGKFLESSDNLGQVVRLGSKLKFKETKLFKKREIDIFLNLYYNQSMLTELNLVSSVELIPAEGSILCISFDGLSLSSPTEESEGDQGTTIPFYYERRLASETFKGFLSEDYHSRQFLKISTEYRLSIYRDFIYTGLFFDSVFFQASEHDLTGNKFAIAGGLVIQLLILDQLNFRLYGGPDYLFEDNLSKFNIYFALTIEF